VTYWRYIIIAIINVNINNNNIIIINVNINNNIIIIINVNITNCN